MDSKTYLGALGEAKAIALLTEQKYHVFSQVTGKAPFDLVAYKEGALYRVSVKTVEKRDRKGVFSVQLKTVRSNRSGNRIIGFDNTSCDILAVYLVEEDEMILFNSSEITVTSVLTIRRDPVDRGTRS